MDTTIICEGCGAVCHIDDGYCKHCWKKLPIAPEDEQTMLDGFGRSAWRSFIDKNTDYYMPIYEQNEGKKVFARMNWAAFFGGCFWLLYRKMYKIAILFYAISIVASLLVPSLFYLPFASEINELKEKVAIVYEDDTIDDIPSALLQEALTAQTRLKVIETIVAICSDVTTTILQLVTLGLFGNALYKAHILKGLDNLDPGGVSVVSAVIGSISITLIASFFISPLLSFVFKVITALP